MAPLSRLGRQIAEVTTALQRVGAPYALIGGLALASHHVIRVATNAWICFTHIGRSRAACWRKPPN
jgi:hypothetical protein